MRGVLALLRWAAPLRILALKCKRRRLISEQHHQSAETGCLPLPILRPVTTNPSDLANRKGWPMAEPVTFYAVRRERGGSWDAALPMREQDKWDEHASFMNALADDGFVVLGGPLGDGAQILLVVRADSEDEIKARLAKDPWTAMGLLRIANVERWQILLGSDG